MNMLNRLPMKNKKLLVIAGIILLLPISAAFAFTDTDGHTNEEAIEYLYEQGIVEGYGDGTYGPDNKINRAEFTKILIESKYPGEATGSYCFDDVAGDWYAKYVCYAKELGIVQGYGDGTFGPATYINLAEALKVVIETYEVELTQYSADWAWYVPYQRTAEDIGLLDYIYSDVADEIDRGEMAQLIYNIEDYCAGQCGGQEGPSVVEISIPAYDEGNAKNDNAYEDEEVFIISDENWDNVLSFASVAKEYPYLILHESNGVLDIDSAMYFLDDYNVSRVTLIGETLEEVESYFDNFADTNEIAIESYFEYWGSCEDIVYVEQDYELALLAASLAGFMDVPLVVEGSVLDDEDIFANRNVLVVGDLSCPADASDCDFYSSVSELQDEILEYVDGDKVLLVNPEDIGMGVDFDDLKSAFTGEPIPDGIGNDSMAAVSLSIQKEELIITDIDQLDDFDAEYLTIVASPNAIPIAELDEDGLYYELDNSDYGDLDGDSVVDLAVGRMYGLTATDTSVLVARSIFYDDLDVGDEAALLWAPDFLMDLIDVYILESWLEQAGVSSEVFAEGTLDCSSYSDCFSDKYDLEEVLQNKWLIDYQSHGSYYGGVLDFDTFDVKDSGVQLASSVIVTSACSMCSFDKAAVASNVENLFCLNMIRQGAVAFTGALEDAAANIDLPRLYIYELLGGNSLGESLLPFKEQSYMYDSMIFPEVQDYFFEPYFILLGDPTLIVSDDVNSYIDFEGEVELGSSTITLTFPEVSSDSTVAYDFYLTGGDHPNEVGEFYMDDLIDVSLSSGQILKTEDRAYYSHFFNLPVAGISSVELRDYYEDSEDEVLAAINFLEVDGETWFFLEEVFYDLGDDGGLSERVLVMDFN